MRLSQGEGVESPARMNGHAGLSVTWPSDGTWRLLDSQREHGSVAVYGRGGGAPCGRSA